MHYLPPPADFEIPERTDYEVTFDGMPLGVHLIPVEDGAILTDTTNTPPWQHRSWFVLLTYRTECMAMTWNQGTGIDRVPTATGILGAIARDASFPDDLADFAEETGYDDVRAAIRVHTALQQQKVDLDRLFGSAVPLFVTTYQEQ